MQEFLIESQTILAGIHALTIQIANVRQQATHRQIIRVDGHDPQQINGQSSLPDLLILLFLNHLILGVGASRNAIEQPVVILEGGRFGIHRTQQLLALIEGVNIHPVNLAVRLNHVEVHEVIAFSVPQPFAHIMASRHPCRFAQSVGGLPRPRRHNFTKEQPQKHQYHGRFKHRPRDPPEGDARSSNNHQLTVVGQSAQPQQTADQ